MGNIVRRRTLIALAALLTVSLGATSQAGVEACKPTVTVTNFKNARIRVLNFKYKVGDNTIYTEGLANKILRTNDFEDWPKQSLRHAGNGVRVSSSAVEYEVEIEGGWTTPRNSTFVTHTYNCGENHHYNHEIR